VNVVGNSPKSDEEERHDEGCVRQDPCPCCHGLNLFYNS
jgi:uncharacterized protein YecA (UPF0149 family)